MCYIFAGEDPENYAFISRSVRLSGHSTSVRLESKFWTIIDEIARLQQLSTAKFLNTLYEEALEIHGDIHNFASLLRCTCLLYLSNPVHSIDTAKQQLVESSTKPLTIAQSLGSDIDRIFTKY